MIKVEATDSDEPDNANSDIRYRILRQDPQLPSDNMFEINSVTGAISVAGTGLDREVSLLTHSVTVSTLASSG